MNKIPSGNLKKDWPLNHLGFVVKDMDKAMTHYEQLGIANIGPEYMMEAFDGNSIKVRIVRIGSLVLEFFQPPEGVGVSGKYLQEYGEGINHLAYTVKDIDKEVNELVASGMKLMFQAEDPDFGRVAYFDTGETAGVVMELVQPPTKDV